MANRSLKLTVPFSVHREYPCWCYRQNYFSDFFLVRRDKQDNKLSSFAFQVCYKAHVEVKFRKSFCFLFKNFSFIRPDNADTDFIFPDFKRRNFNRQKRLLPFGIVHSFATCIVCVRSILRRLLFKSQVNINLKFICGLERYFILQ